MPTPKTLTLQQAWGNIQIIRLPTDMPNNEVFVFDHAATTDGQWLVGSVEPRDMVDNTSVTPYVALYNITTRQIKFIHSLLSPQYQVLSASSDGNWLVWSEDTPNTTNVDWAIESYNLRTGAFKQLAQDTRINGVPVNGTNPQPVVSNGYAIWGEDTDAVSESDPSSFKYAEVRLAQLDTGTITTLATSASGGALSWPWAAWGEFTPLGSGSFNGDILFKNLVTGQTKRLNETPNYIVMDGLTAVFSFLPRQLSEVADITQSMTEQRIYWPTADGAELQEPSISDRLVAWISTSGPPMPLAWDRQQNALITLPTATQTYSGAWTGGHLLVWEDPVSSTSFTICVVDTRSLPANPPV